MSLQAAQVAIPGAQARTALAAVVTVFGIALFSSAFLLFWIEPLIARMLLPRLGGSQSVWNTCVVFFQAMMLAGYSYAHLLGRALPLRGQVLAHSVLVLAGCSFLPVAIAAGWIPPAGTSPVLPLFLLLLGALGWPFFVLSANAPLLQHWFSFSQHRQAESPYFLYALSNAGSLAALVSYPFIIEPAIGLTRQAGFWAVGYLALAVMIGAAGVLAGFNPRAVDGPAIAMPASPSPGWQRRLTWVIFAALPSSLLIGVTAYITTDIASFPLMWIAPLALYLATFVLAFANGEPIPHRLMVKLLPVAIVIAAAGLLAGAFSFIAAIAMQLGAFFLVAMTCHGELARLKPGTGRLTEFYFWLSLGGVIGGALTALVSPLLFSDLIEYPLALSLVCLMRPGADAGGQKQSSLRTWIVAAAILLVLVDPFASVAAGASLAVSLCAIAGVGLAALLNRRDLALIALTVLLASHWEHGMVVRHGSTIWQGRSFYGAYRVVENRRSGYRVLFHGTTIHGVEQTSGTAPPSPLSYYAREGPLGDIMHATAQHSRDIGVIGLGIGGTGCYARPGQSWTFYEIDGLVDEIARRSGLFRSLRECAPNANVVLGDGRLSLQKQGPALYDILVVDAFTSDAIPMHLLTREAFGAYARALKPNGVLAIHISNRHFDLTPIIARIAPEAGLVAYVRTWFPPPGTDPVAIAASRWMVLARDPGDLGTLASNAAWTFCPAKATVRLWTDDFSNVLSALDTSRGPRPACGS